MDSPGMACREEEGSNIAEYALILTMILVLVGGSIRLIVDAITYQ